MLIRKFTEFLGSIRGDLLSAVVLVCGFTAVNFLLPKITRYSLEFYREKSIASALLLEWLSSPMIPLLVVTVAIVFSLKYPSIFNSWKKSNSIQLLRWFIVFTAAVLVWRYATYPYNHFIDQAHNFDRFLCIAFLLAVVWRPIFVLPLLIFIYVVIWQFQSDVGAYSWAQQSMPLTLLTMFSVIFIYSQVNLKLTLPEIVRLLIVVIAAHYWAPGVGKMLLSWHAYGDVHNMVSNAYAKGWLGFLSKEDISLVVRWFEKIDVVVVSITLLLELGILFILQNYRLAILILLTAVIFHAGVFLASGILFWQWIMLDIGLIVWLLKTEAHVKEEIFNFRSMFITAPLIFSSVIWIKPVALAWFDSPVNYTYRFFFVDSKGTGSQLPPSYFAPYEYPFMQSRFSYISKTPTLSITAGATTSMNLARALTAAKNIDDVKSIEMESGYVRFNEQKAEKLDSFVVTMVKNKRDKNTSEKFWFDYFRAPAQLWSLRPESVPTVSDLSHVEIYRVTTWFDGNDYQEIDSQLVRSIDSASFK